MTLQKKNPCHFHDETLHPQYVKYPQLCPWCKGTMEWEGDVSLYYYKGNFFPVNYDNVGTKDEDISLRVVCICGDELFLSEGGDTRVCKCGRIYRLNVSIEVDEDHIGEIDWLIEESNKKE